MPSRAGKPTRPRDVNQLAAKIARLSTGQEKEPPSDEPPPKGATGGKARAASLTDAERRAIAEKAARARWKKS